MFREGVVVSSFPPTERLVETEEELLVLRSQGTFFLHIISQKAFQLLIIQFYTRNSMMLCKFIASCYQSNQKRPSPHQIELMER